MGRIIGLTFEGEPKAEKPEAPAKKKASPKKAPGAKKGE